jgi:mycothiol system anti-sigma-R factor
MNKMECFENESELSLYLDDEVSGARRIALDIHMEVCSKCLKQLIAWKKLKGLVRGASKNQKAPMALKDKISQGILGIVAESDLMIWNNINKSIDNQPAFPSEL